MREREVDGRPGGSEELGPVEIEGGAVEERQGCRSRFGLGVGFKSCARWWHCLMNGEARVVAEEALVGLDYSGGEKVGQSGKDWEKV
jgi:hypothetical protein